MTRLLSGGRGGAFVLGPELDRGGEGAVYSAHAHGLSNLVAKVWHSHTTTSERAKKLHVMLSNPPPDPTLNSGHRSICWPVDVLLEHGKVVGYLMPRLANGMVNLTQIYHPGARQKAFPLMTYKHLVAVARNIASVCETLHYKGYVIGDVNFKNWMVVAQDGRVSVIDTDSFQVRDPSGHVHFCEVIFPGYRAPELKGKNFKGTTLTIHQDAFGLGVLLFQLLVDGNHPTRGLLPDKYGGTEEEKIDNGAFPWGRNRPADQEPVALLAPLYEALTPELQRLFEQCFHDGYTHQTMRPSAARWRHALDSAFHSLVQCSVNKQHWHFPGHGSCTWCAFDLNKSSHAISAKTHSSASQGSMSGGHTPGSYSIPATMPINALPAIPIPGTVNLSMSLYPSLSVNIFWIFVAMFLAIIGISQISQWISHQYEILDREHEAEKRLHGMAYHGVPGEKQQSPVMATPDPSSPPQNAKEVRQWLEASLRDIEKAEQKHRAAKEIPVQNVAPVELEPAKDALLADIADQDDPFSYDKNNGGRSKSEIWDLIFIEQYLLNSQRNEFIDLGLTTSVPTKNPDFHVTDPLQ